MENKQEENPKEIIKEIIITSHTNEVQVALLEDKKLMEIHTEKSSAQSFAKLVAVLLPLSLTSLKNTTPALLMSFLSGIKLL